jgi:hypothetical protein
MKQGAEESHQMYALYNRKTILLLFAVVAYNYLQKEVTKKLSVTCTALNFRERSLQTYLNVG